MCCTESVNGLSLHSCCLYLRHPNHSGVVYGSHVLGVQSSQYSWILCRLLGLEAYRRIRSHITLFWFLTAFIYLVQSWVIRSYSDYIRNWISMLNYLSIYFPWSGKLLRVTESRYESLAVYFLTKGLFQRSRLSYLLSECWLSSCFRLSHLYTLMTCKQQQQAGVEAHTVRFSSYYGITLVKVVGWEMCYSSGQIL